MAINELLVAGAVPTATAEGRNVDQRGDGRGNAFTRAMGKSAPNAAASACYYMSRNAAVGTGATGVATTTGVSDTQALIHLFNNASSGGSTICLDYIKIRVGTAGLNGTTTGFFTKTYYGGTRYSSGGTAFTPQNCNAASTATSSATLHVGAVLLGTANGTERLLSAQALRSAIAVAGDHYWFDFGPNQMSAHNGLVVSGTAISNLVIPCCPVALAPQSGFQFGIYGASQDTAAVYEWEIGYYEL